MNFTRAQQAHDAKMPPDEEWNEPKDCHEAQAIAEIKADPDALFDMFARSAFWKEYAMFLYDKSDQFQAEIARSQRVKDRAQELADAEYQARLEEAEYEWATNRREREL